MTATIAFVHRLDADEVVLWCDALSAQLPEAQVSALEDIPLNARGGITIAIVANPDPVDLATLPDLKWIHSLWAGVERLMAELPADGPPVTRLVDPEMARNMAESAMAWTYYLQRDMPAYAAQQSQKLWQPLPYRHPRDMTIGILGLGQMGMASAARLQDAGFTVTGWSQSPKAAGFDTYIGVDGLIAMLGRSDICLCLLPLTEQTRGLVGAEALAALPAGAALVNFGRGPIVDADALVAALDSGHISHAVLDVFAEEPLPSVSPLWTHPAVTVLPHITAITDPSTASRIVAGNVRHYLASGDLPETVDRTRGY